jgi:hypothetical protein
MQMNPSSEQNLTKVFVFNCDSWHRDIDVDIESKKGLTYHTMGIGIGNGALLQIPCLFRIKLDVGAQFKGVRLLLAKASNRNLCHEYHRQNL